MADLTAKRTTVTLYSDIPLKPPHSGANDTFYFTNSTAQKAYFDTKAKFTISGNSYQNIYKGVFRAKVTETMWNQGGLNNMNYMSFVNENFENKRYYAFITSINLISNGTLEINYRIDNVQTWWDEFKRQQCYVERCHAASDAVGSNIQPEPCDPGTPKEREIWNDPNFTTSEMILLVATTYDYEQPSETAKYGGNVLGGIPNAAIYIPFSYDAKTGGKIVRADGVSEMELSGWIYNMTTQGKFDAIIGGVVIPKGYYSESAKSSAKEVYLRELFKTAQSGALDGYTPRNNKLYTAPYHYITLEDGLGNSRDLRIEFFSDPEDISFYVYYATSLTMTLYLVPRNYNGKTRNNEEGLTMCAWPQATIATDTFKAYAAQNAGSMVGSVVGTVTGAIASIVSNPASVAETLVTGVSQLAGTAGSFYDVSRKPPTVTGVQGDGTALVQGLQEFTVTEKYVRNEYARKIDSFFQMFGYAQNQVMTPPIHNRAKWTYVKTAGCIITGSIPAEANADIASIFDSGVRFWDEKVKFGQYDQDNAPMYS